MGLEDGSFGKVLMIQERRYVFRSPDPIQSTWVFQAYNYNTNAKERATQKGPEYLMAS